MNTKKVHALLLLVTIPLLLILVTSSPLFATRNRAEDAAPSTQTTPTRPATQAISTPAWSALPSQPPPESNPQITRSRLPPLLQSIRLAEPPQGLDFPISALSLTSEESPAIDGSKVVWHDDRSHGPTDVWMRDLSTRDEFQVTSHPDAQFIADIAGNIVVYEDNRNGTWDIYATRLDTREEFPVATGPYHQRYPRVWGDYIVYQDETSDYWQSDVYLYRISTDSTTNLAVAPGFQGDPDIDEGWVIWRDNRDGKWQVRAYNILENSYHVLDSGTCWGAIRHPRIGGGMAVWQDICTDWPEPGYDIFGYDFSTGELVTIYSGPGQQEWPDVSDTLIVWQDEDTYGNWNVFVYVRENGTIFPVTLEPSLQQKPAVFGNTVVWQDNRSHTWDIYGFVWDGTVPPGTTALLQNPRDLHVGAYPDGAIRVAWTDTVTNELGFTIQRAEGIFSVDWQEYATLPPNTTVYTDTETTIGQSYWYRVRAFNDQSSSSYSNESYTTAFDTVPNLDERYMHLLINEARMDPGAWGYPALTPVDPLDWNANLAYSAKAHALGMNNSNCCQGHVDLANRGPGERAYDSGYIYGAGENLFVAQSGKAGIEAAHQGFMDSTGHRNNILAPAIRQTAIGFAPGGRGTLVEVFSGGPPDTIVPALPSGIAVPYTGTVDTIFDFLVSFWNDQALAPRRAVVVVDGVSYPMMLRSGQPGRGTYVYSTHLSRGTHTYHYEFTWGNPETTARLPTTGAYEGPHVREYMPDLSLSLEYEGQPVAGYPSQIGAWVRNSGEVMAENVATRFYRGNPRQGGVQIGATQVITQIPPGEFRLTQITWTPTTTGAEIIYAWVDPDNTIVEAHEDNNLASQTLTVREANLVWYVDRAMDASGDGRSPTTAFKTIAEALGQAAPGDTVVVAPGIYSERFQIPQGVGLVGHGLADTVIDGGGNEGSVIAMMPDSILAGFTVQGSGPGYFDAAIWHEKGAITVRQNRFVGNSVGLMSYCSDADCQATALLQNNLFQANSRAAIDATSEPVHHILNNVVLDNDRGLILNNARSVAENNIIVRNQVGVLGYDKDAIVRFNDIWDNQQDTAGVPLGEGNISADPQFMDAGQGNYHLAPESPAVDAGNPEDAYQDPDGSRNDMGLYGDPLADTKLTFAELALNPSSPQAGQRFTVTLTLSNTGALAQDLRVVTRIPQAVDYIPDSATTTLGESIQADDTLTFTVGTLPTDWPVTVTYAVKAPDTLVSPEVIRFPFTVSWSTGTMERELVAIVNGRALYLPLVLRP